MLMLQQQAAAQGITMPMMPMMGAGFGMGVP
jgi:hypothetical protein